MGANDKVAATFHPHVGGLTYNSTVTLIEAIRERALTGVRDCRQANETHGNQALLTILALIERTEESAR